MFYNKEDIANLRNKITDTLLPLIDDDYSLLDAPNYVNIGDSLIYEGELALLKLLPYKALFAASIKFTRLSQLPQKGMILFQGGGNFGDIWPRFQLFRRNIIEKRKHQKIIIFPQTVFYEDEENIMADAAIFNAHPNLTICVRDLASFELLNRYFYNNKILLLPDMAFCLDLQQYHRDNTTGKMLVLKRTDKEMKASDNDIRHFLSAADGSKIAEINDWPGMQLSDAQKRIVKWKERENKYTTRLLNFFSGKSNRPDLNFGVRKLYHSRQQMLLGIHFLQQYDVVYSTRLHGAILAVLLNKRVYILDNSYGKNAAFYDCWLAGFENCHLIR